MPVFFAKRALLPSGWSNNVSIHVSAVGLISTVEKNSDSRDAEIVEGPLLPGMPNLHSHAFQRAMAGLAEIAGDPQDSFWTWRDLMYRMVGRMTPDHLEAIAKHLYVEMLKAGYTSVAEFHYLHHDQTGKPYSNLIEMGARISHAAESTGIGLTLLPVLYTYSGFGSKPPTEGQRRFINDSGTYLKMHEQLEVYLTDAGQQLGTCFHSLRATAPEQLIEVLQSTDPLAPVHIHIAEQHKEVEDCLAWSRQRPVQWLYNNIDVDKRWCLVHATHVSTEEVAFMARSKAIAGLCPTTEANLGDGIFPAVDFINQGGFFGFGSDSHVSVSVTEELRWLEYSQRLRDQRRNRLTTTNQKNIATVLYEAGLQGGRQALGQPIGAIEPGARADWIVLDGQDPYIQNAKSEDLLNRWIFGGGNHQIKDVMVKGKWVIQNGHHLDEEAISEDFSRTLKTVLS